LPIGSVGQLALLLGELKSILSALAPELLPQLADYTISLAQRGCISLALRFQGERRADRRAVF
jgi:hypothetical protein